MATTTDDAIPAYPGISNATSADRMIIFKDGDPQQRMISLADLRKEMGETAPAIDSITQSVTVSEFTDGGSTAGTLELTEVVPAGAVLLGSKVLVTGAFDGDTSATLIIGDGSDTDRYMTGTPSVFAAAATGIETGVPSGNKLVTADNQPVLTVTTAADFSSCKTADNGAATVTIYFIRTVDV